MTVRKYQTSLALKSFSSLLKVLNELSMEEVLYCLDFESKTQRRSSILDRLMSRAVRLNELQFVEELKARLDL